MIFIKNCNSKPSISYFSKLILFTLLATSCLPIAYSSIIRDTLNVGFYVGLTGFLTAKYPEEPKLVRCIIKTFKFFKIEEDFVSWNTVTNPQEASDDITNHVKYAEVYCRIEGFVMSPIGLVCAVVLIIIFAIACIFRLCLRMMKS